MVGSSRDPWQSYNGEHTVVLDELRPNIIPHQELLRLLDPFGYDTEVVAGSRFYDKAITADLIIITTPYTPMEFFNKAVGNTTTDHVAQLMRRLTLIIHMAKLEIVAMKYDYKTSQLIPLANTIRFNRYSKTNTSDSATKALDLYASMFEGDDGL